MHACTRPSHESYILQWPRVRSATRGHAEDSSHKTPDMHTPSFINITHCAVHDLRTRTAALDMEDMDAWRMAMHWPCSSAPWTQQHMQACSCRSRHTCTERSRHGLHTRQLHPQDSTRREHDNISHNIAHIITHTAPHTPPHLHHLLLPPLQRGLRK